MGEKIRDLGEINLFERSMTVELNKATYKNGPRYIHIQNNNGRYQLTEEEFIKFVCIANKSAYQLRYLKNMEGDF
ncbi:MAG: hypothetical protein LBG80_20575 [Bacteroidales bacterium]|nr:hypothetical protein [Bacteroidales bacterium]